MEAARLPRRRRRRSPPVDGRGLLRPFAFLAGPAAVLGLLFLAPMAVMLVISLQYGILSGSSGLHAQQLHRRLQRPALSRGRLDDGPDRDARDADPARDRDPDRLRARLQGRQVGAAAAALPRPRRRAQPDGPDLRLADAARPRGADQRGPAADRAHRRADRRAAVQQVRGDRRALDQLPDLHGDPDLRGDEGDRQEPLRGRARSRRRLVDAVRAGCCCR